MNAKLSSLIGSGANDATALGAAAHDDRAATQLRAVTLLDGGVEGVHVDVQNVKLVDGHADSPMSRSACWTGSTIKG